MTPTRRTLLIAALVLLSVASIVFGFLGAWQIASTGRVPAALSTAPLADPAPPIQVTINALILNGSPALDTQADAPMDTEGLAHAFLMIDGNPAVRILRTAAPSASTPQLGQAMAERAVEAIRTEAQARGWSIAVAVVDAQGHPVAMAHTPHTPM